MWKGDRARRRRDWFNDAKFGIFVHWGLYALHAKNDNGPYVSWAMEQERIPVAEYEPYADLYRPGHGDFTYHKKYGIRDWRGGGRASARETAARVAAGAVAKAILEKEEIEVIAYTKELGGIEAVSCDLSKMHENPYLCPDQGAAEKIESDVLVT